MLYEAAPPMPSLPPILFRAHPANRRAGSLAENSSLHEAAYLLLQEPPLCGRRVAHNLGPWLAPWDIFRVRRLPVTPQQVRPVPRAEDTLATLRLELPQLRDTPPYREVTLALSLRSKDGVVLPYTAFPLNELVSLDLPDDPRRIGGPFVGMVTHCEWGFDLHRPDVVEPSVILWTCQEIGAWVADHYRED